MKWLESLEIDCHICRLGNCFIDQKMREVGAQVGGETSGHYLFYDYKCDICGVEPIKNIKYTCF
jgi:phosphomannomutase